MVVECLQLNEQFIVCDMLCHSLNLILVVSLSQEVDKTLVNGLHFYLFFRSTKNPIKVSGL